MTGVSGNKGTHAAGWHQRASKDLETVGGDVDGPAHVRAGLAAIAWRRAFLRCKEI